MTVPSWRSTWSRPGRCVPVSGNTKALGPDADTEHLLGLRTRFDAVLIGGGTIRRNGTAGSSPSGIPPAPRSRRT